MQTGPEIGVASTKAYTAPLVDLYMLAVLLGELRSTLTETRRKQLIADLRLVPALAGKCLDREPQVEKVARALMNTSHCLYLGRGINMPTAYEGALKLKEISYIHAEGYPAGEMKHGPIALLEEGFPVVAVAQDQPTRDKLLGNLMEVRARGARLLAVAEPDADDVAEIVDLVLPVPRVHRLLQPVVGVIPLQLLAYHVARELGHDVDQPRNLAKSVTVE